MPDTEPDRRLALLIAAPHGPETAQQRDVQAMSAALHQRGLSRDEIWVQAGNLAREHLVSFLATAARHVRHWSSGQLFLHYSGHGAFRGPSHPETASQVLPAMQPDTDDLSHRWLWWEDAFTILALPSGVHLTLVPDCEHTNLLEGRLPPNASALAMKPSSPDEWLACHAPEHDFPADHGLARRGIISYYAAQTLPVARTMDEWLQEIQRAMSVDLASGVLPRLKQPLLQVLGIPTARLPGHVAM